MPEGVNKGPLAPEASKLTGLKKRQQIELAGRVMFIWVAIAAAALSFCVATGQYLFAQWQHNNKVIHAKQVAAGTLQSNIESAKTLKEEVDKLVASQELASVKTNESDPNTKSILDALPTTFDPAALATSLQQAILNRSGVAIESITVPPEVAVAEGDAVQPTEPKPQEVKFSFTVSGSYDKIKTLMGDIQRTIRPIAINSLNITGDDADLRVICEATTYYQPAKTVDVKKESVR